MTFTQLDPVLPIRIEGKGEASAFAVIHRGQDQDLIWVGALKDTGEICCVSNPQVRIQSNWITERIGLDVDAAVTLN